MTPERDDLLIEGCRLPNGEIAELSIRNGRIARITDPDVAAVGDAARTIKAADMLLLPGLCNAHLHSMELPLRGMVSGLPMELYRVRIAALGMGAKVSPEDVYARTRAACLEMLLGGTTSATDDVVHEALDEAYVDAVLNAYVDMGLRARVTIHLEDRPWTESVPFLDELIPAKARSWVEAPSDTSVDEMLEVTRAAVERWAGHERVRCIPGPSAPQRCTVPLLAGLKEISEAYDVPFHIHVQETLMQAASGPLMFGKSMAAWLDELGVLDPRTTIAHGVWLSESDIELIAARGASVIHNPTSNLKLGSGVAPVRRMLDAGVNVGLGGDGYTCNDRQDMFEAMKTACLLSDITTTDFTQWLTPDEILKMATLNGARANLLDSVGTIEEGAAADLILVKLDPPEFQPRNDPIAQSVFAGDGRHVDTVIVAGEVLVENGRALHVNEQEVWRASEQAASRYLEAARPYLERMARLMPAHIEAYRRCVRSLRETPLPDTAVPTLSLEMPPSAPFEQ